jgi:DNA-binding NtrC family response regulator
LSLHAPAAKAAPAMPRDLASIERQMIESTLRRTSGNKSKAARVLGLTRTQLYVRLRRHGLDDLIWD